MQIPQQALGPLERRDPALAGGVQQVQQVLQGVAHPFDALAQAVEFLRPRVADQPAGIEEEGTGEGPMPFMQPLRQGLAAQAGEGGPPLPAPQPRQQLEVAGGDERFAHRLEGQAPLPLQPFEGGPQGLALLARQEGQETGVEPLAQHIEVAAEAGAAGEGGDAAAAHPIRQLQGGGELVQGGAQPPQTDPELMQRLRIRIRQHRPLQVRQTPGVALDQREGVLAVAQGRQRGGVHQRGPHQLSPAWGRRAVSG
jgi:hypothetical protein